MGIIRRKVFCILSTQNHTAEAIANDFHHHQKKIMSWHLLSFHQREHKHHQIQARNKYFQFEKTV